MKKTLFYILFIFGISFVNTYAQNQTEKIESNVKIFLETSKNEVFVDEVFQVRLILENNTSKDINLNSLIIPGLSKFKLIGSSMEESSFIMNDKRKSLKKYIKTVIPNSDGFYNIGPISLNINSGSDLLYSAESNTLNIIVKKKETPSVINAMIDNIKKSNFNYSLFYIPIVLAISFIFIYLVRFIRIKNILRKNQKNSQINEVGDIKQTKSQSQIKENLNPNVLRNDSIKNKKTITNNQEKDIQYEKILNEIKKEKSLNNNFLDNDLSNDFFGGSIENADNDIKRNKTDSSIIIDRNIKKNNIDQIENDEEKETIIPNLQNIEIVEDAGKIIEDNIQYIDINKKKDIALKINGININTKDDDFYKKIKNATVSYIYKKLSIDITKMSTQDINNILLDKNIKNKNGLYDILKICDAGIYGKKEVDRIEFINLCMKILG